MKKKNWKTFPKIVGKRNNKPISTIVDKPDQAGIKRL